MLAAGRTTQMYLTVVVLPPLPSSTCALHRVYRLNSCSVVKEEKLNDYDFSTTEAGASHTYPCDAG